MKCRLSAEAAENSAFVVSHDSVKQDRAVPGAVAKWKAEHRGRLLHPF